MGNVTHYCSIERANESDNNDYYGKSACGLEYFENGDDKLKYVTCKNCLRVMAKSNNKAKATLPINSVVKTERSVVIVGCSYQWHCEDYKDGKCTRYNYCKYKC